MLVLAEAKEAAQKREGGERVKSHSVSG